MLLRYAESILQARGHRLVTLWVYASNDPARRFYEAMGYQPDGASKRSSQERPLQIRYRRRFQDAGSGASPARRNVSRSEAGLAHPKGPCCRRADSLPHTSWRAPSRDPAPHGVLYRRRDGQVYFLGLREDRLPWKACGYQLAGSAPFVRERLRAAEAAGIREGSLAWYLLTDAEPQARCDTR